MDYRAWRRGLTLWATTGRVSAPLAADRLATTEPPAPLVIDVRTPREHRQQRVAGSINIPLNHLTERLSELAEGPASVGALRGRLPILDCGEPPAAARLHECGRNRGGHRGWEAAHLPLVSD